LSLHRASRHPRPRHRRSSGLSSIPIHSATRLAATTHRASQELRRCTDGVLNLTRSRNNRYQIWSENALVAPPPSSCRVRKPRDHALWNRNVKERRPVTYIGQAATLSNHTQSVEAHRRPPTARLSEKDRRAPLIFSWDKDTPLRLPATTPSHHCWHPTLLRSGPPRTPPLSAHLLCSDAPSPSGTLAIPANFRTAPPPAGRPLTRQLSSCRAALLPPATRPTRCPRRLPVPPTLPPLPPAPAP